MLIFKLKTQESPTFFFASSEKKPFTCARARHDEYCAITLTYSAEIRTVDSQSDLRILLWL